MPDTRLWWFRPRHWQLFLTQVSKTATLTTGTFDPDFVTMVPLTFITYPIATFSHTVQWKTSKMQNKRFLLQVAKMCFCNLMVSTASSTCRSLYFRGIPDIVCISLQFEIFLVLHWLQNKNSTRSLSGCPRANKPKSRHKDGAESEPLRWFNSILVMSILAL